MNKRIQKLAENTDRACEHLGRSDIGEEWLEKFAELIVQDCMNICEQQRLKILNNPNDPSWTEHLAECQITMEQTFLRS